MAFIDPSHIPATGNSEIDRDHQLLAETMNRIYAGWQSGMRCPDLGKPLTELRGLLARHFAKETVIARGAGYSQWLAHHQEHKEFLRRFDAFVAECQSERGRQDARIDVFMELERHLFDHEVLTDQEMWGLWRREDDPAEGEALIGWRAEYAVGIEQIDEQHKKLISQINEAFRILCEGGETLAHVFARLKSIYLEALHHFQSEEKYFSQLPADLADNHRQSHEGLIRELKRAVDDSEEADVERMRSLLSGYLKFWLLDHILNADGRLREYLK